MKSLSTRKSLDIKIRYFKSPIGYLEIGGTDENIVSVNFLEANPDRDAQVSFLLEDCIQQLDEYFQKKRQKFDLPILPKEPLFKNWFGKNYWKFLSELPIRISILRNESGIPRQSGLLVLLMGKIQFRSLSLAIE